MEHFPRVALNNLRNAPLATKQAIRVGRGRAGRRPKQSGRGMKGLKARNSLPVGFNGGQTPMYRAMPKHGHTNPRQVEYEPLNLDTLIEFITNARIDPKEKIDLRTLREAGAVGKIEHGVKLLARGSEKFDIPLNLEVSRASKQAIAAVEKAGGSISCVYRNKLNLRAHLKPEKFDTIPRPALPNSHARVWYEDPANRGVIPALVAAKKTAPTSTPPTTPKTAAAQPVASS
eukprot:m.52856 g.52856  ORF g.52856 m.52856 type:complete len:231 (+) comp13106_c0_seq1:69-761(+)